MFEDFKLILDAMTPAQRAAKLAALNDITRLRTLCKAKGWAELEPEKNRIVITDRQKEVEELLQAITAAGMVDIKIYVLQGNNEVKS